MKMRFFYIIFIESIFFVYGLKYCVCMLVYRVDNGLINIYLAYL